MKRLPIPAVILLVVVVAATAVGLVVANRGDDTRAGMGPGMTDPGSSSTPGWWDDSWKLHDGPEGLVAGRLRSTGRDDGLGAVASEPEYLAQMVAHQEEAVAAARELARSDRPQMRAFGESIVETQSAQIQQMNTWLQDWYPDQWRTSTTGR